MNHINPFSLHMFIILFWFIMKTPPRCTNDQHMNKCVAVAHTCLQRNPLTFVSYKVGCIFGAACNINSKATVVCHERRKKQKQLIFNASPACEVCECPAGRLGSSGVPTTARNCLQTNHTNNKHTTTHIHTTHVHSSAAGKRLNFALVWVSDCLPLRRALHSTLQHTHTSTCHRPTASSLSRVLALLLLPL